MQICTCPLQHEHYDDYKQLNDPKSLLDRVIETDPETKKLPKWNKVNPERDKP